MTRVALTTVVLVLSTACASAPPVDMSAMRRVVGTESLVRVDAEIVEEMTARAPIAITYVITNERATAIAVADLIPLTTFDHETRTLTVSIGAEVPGEVMLPRLVRIGPGEKKSFRAAARMAAMIIPASANPRAVNRTLLRLKVNFLGDTAPFAELIDIPEKSIADPRRAEALFAPWLERNEVLYTNAIPVQVTGARSVSANSAESGRGSAGSPARRRKP